jgi:ankyrin repeat protein
METALMIAAPLDHREVVKLLISNEEVDVNRTGQPDSKSVLLQAVKKNKVWLVKLLLKRRDLDVNYGDRCRKSALSYAAENNSLEILQCLLDKPGVIIDNRDLDHYTPLALAARQGHTEIFRTLLGSRKVASIGSVGNGQASMQSEDAMDIERREPNINAKDKNGETALCSAVWNGCTELLQVLLPHGADVNAVTITGRLPTLHYAARYDHTGSLRVLLSHGANVNAISTDGLTALHYAAGNGQTELEKMYVEKCSN